MEAKTFKLPFIEAKSQPQTDKDAPAPAPRSTDSLARSLAENRPILTHINADTTWLLLLPYPPNTSPRPQCRYYRILFDPWLTGPQSDVYAWFSTQWHAIPSSIQTIAELSEFLESVDGEGPTKGGIDAVFISHEFTDHCHKGTLLQIPKEVPVFANDKAFELIKSWKHFDKVLEPRKFPSLQLKNGQITEWDWRGEARNHSGGKGPLPSWMGITRVESPGNALYYHSSVMVTFANTADEGQISADDGAAASAECILYTPHGTEPSTLEGLDICKPAIKPLALLHGLHDVKLGFLRYKQLNLGAKNGIRCVKSCGGAKYWVGTHDERKVAGGMIKKMLQRKAWTVKEVVEECAGELGEADLGGRYVEVGNGETLILA